MVSRFESELQKLEKLLDKLNRKNRRANLRGGASEEEAPAVPAGTAPVASVMPTTPVMPEANSMNGTGKGSGSGSGSEMTGGRRLQGGRSKEERDYRSFRVTKVDGKTVSDGPKAKLYLETKDGKRKDKVSITEVAQKLFNQLCREKGGNRASCKITFSLVETTREAGAEYKELTYRGEVVKKAKAVVLVDKKTGKKRSLKYDALVHRVF